EDFLPGLAAVGRAEQAALGVRAERVAERRDEGGVRIARAHDHPADVARAVEKRPPVRAAVGGLPHAPGDRAEVEDLRLAGDAGHGEHAPAAEGTDEAPLQGAGGGNVGGGPRGEEDEESKYAASTVHPRILI